LHTELFKLRLNATVQQKIGDIMIDWKIERVSVKKLKPWAENPRDVDEENVKYLKESFNEFGFAGVIITNKDYTICGGHRSLECLIENGVSEVDIKRPSKQLNKEQFKRLNYRLNQNIAGKWNEQKLYELFSTSDIIELGNNEDHLAIFKKMEALNTVDEAMVQLSKEVSVPNMNYPDEAEKPKVTGYPSDKDEENKLQITKDDTVLFSCLMREADRDKVIDIINRTKRAINSNSTPECLIKIMEHYNESKLQSF
jgi:hypothetical protein